MPTDTKYATNQIPTNKIGETLLPIARFVINKYVKIGNSNFKFLRLIHDQFTFKIKTCSHVFLSKKRPIYVPKHRIAIKIHAIRNAPSTKSTAHQKKEKKNISELSVSSVGEIKDSLLFTERSE